MPTATFNHADDTPSTLVPGQTMDIQMFGPDFDANTAVTHFRYKMYAWQAATEALYYFKVEFFNTAMNEDSGSFWNNNPIVIQDGWIGEAGEQWGSTIDPADWATFVSDHAYYETEEGAWTGPYYDEVYEASDGGSIWQNNVIDDVTTDNRLPGGGTWFLRISLDAAAPGNITLEDFSFEFTYQEFVSRDQGGEIFFPVSLTEGWACNNDHAPHELYVLIHRGRAYLYGLMLDWENWNYEEDDYWFTNPYDDATTKLVDVGGLPERARPAIDTIVPFRFYDFDRSSVVLGLPWKLSVNVDGSITFVERPGKTPDKLRLGGGDYSFAPMQIRWPIADQEHGPDAPTFEAHDELRNAGETSGETWTVDHTLELAGHGGVVHLRGGVHHSQTPPCDVPLWHSGGIFSSGVRKFRGVKLFDESGVGVGQDFGYIQQLTPENTEVTEAGAPVKFDASKSTGTEPLEFEWDFGDGDTGTGIKPSHRYEEAGTYSVTLTVTNANGRTDDVTKEVVVEAGDVLPEYIPHYWSAFINDAGAVINGPGEEVIFLSGDPDTQIFKGSNPSAWDLGDSFAGAEVLDEIFTVDKHRLGSGLRRATVNISSPEMEQFPISAVGRKYGTVICIQDDGSHYRHEVQCTAVSTPGNNTYTHKLFKNVGGSDTQLGSTVTNNIPNCLIRAQISFTDVLQILWKPNGTSFVTVVDNSVPRSGGWGFFYSTSPAITINAVVVTGNDTPLYPDEDEVVNLNAWWPNAYEFDEPSS